MSESKPLNSEDRSAGEAIDANRSRRPYSPPKVLSAEPLEAAAATCDPPSGVFGKVGPPTCGTLGS